MKPKFYLLFRLISVVILFFIVQTNLSGQTLIWQDNFDAPTINQDHWTFDFGDGCERGLCGWGNGELQYYTSRQDNARIENGNLVIEAKRENFLTREFTSARLKTEGRIHFKYGTLEARIKVPNLANGLWPAFWLLGTTGTWPQNGEIDIAEWGIAEAIAANRVNRTVGAAVHWSYNGSQADYGEDYVSPVNLNDDYHIYKMTWDESFIRVYIDNIEYFAFDISNIASASLEEFHIPHFIILNLAIGGQYTGINSPAGITAPLPGKMLIDYIRLYQNPGNEFYAGKNAAKSGSYGVFTETAPVSEHVAYGTDANLFLWNNLTSTATSPYEGSEAWSFRANAGSWFGMGVASDYKNMSNFYGGHLRFHMKTTSTHTFRIGISTGHGDSWVSLSNGSNQYGLVRNGAWHEVSIPFTAFNNLDLYSVKQLIMVTGDPPGSAVEFAIDNVYYSGGGASNVAPSVAITSPANNATYAAPATIVINAAASDSDGNVTKVDFYNGTTLLGTDTSSPYSYSWNNVGQGNYTLTAVATDNGGATKTSVPVAINVTGATLPSPWQTMDIGSVAASGSAAHSNGTYTVRGSGADIWDTADEFRFVYRTLTGNGTIVARLGSLTNTDGWAKAGVMIRETLASNSRHAMTALTPSNGVSFQRRTSAGGTSASTTTGGTIPGYIRIERMGNTFTSSYSTNGSSWTSIGSTTISMASTVYVGLAVTSHNDGVLTTAVFNNVSVTTPNTPPVVSITSPSSGASFNTPATINIAANATDTDGTITKVDFYNGTTLLGTDTSSPYSYTWNSVSPGNYTITAVATDNGGAAVTSAPVSITVNGSTSSNLALNKPVTTSSIEGAGFEGQRAVDGNASTRWSSQFSDPQWIYVDLGSTYTINRVKVTWEAAHARDYQVQVSSNTTTWSTIRTVSGNTTLTNDHTGLSGAGRYVRINGTARGTSFGYSIFELEVYGSPGASGSGCSGTASNGDYTYQVSTTGGTVNWTFIPQQPILGSTMAILYVRVGNGAYAGYPMNSSGGNFIFSQNHAAGTQLTFYFTYRVGTTAAERNSSANPHTYTSGAVFTSAASATPPLVIEERNGNIDVYPNPATSYINLTANELEKARIQIIDGHGKVVIEQQAAHTIDTTGLPAGLYTLVYVSNGNRTIKRFVINVSE